MNIVTARPVRATRLGCRPATWIRSCAVGDDRADPGGRRRGTGDDVLLRRAARIALRVKAELDVVHLTVSDATLPGHARPVDRLRELTADLGARWHQIQDDDPAEAIVSFARDHQIIQIVIGSIQHSWWHLPGGGPIVRQVIHEAGASGIDVHLIARANRLPPGSQARVPPGSPDLAPVGRDPGCGGLPASA